jgi:hypothetical protein
MSLTLNPFGLSFYEYKGGKNRMSTSTYYIISGTDNVSLGQGDPVEVRGSTNGYVTAYAGVTAPTAEVEYNSDFNSLVVGVAVSFSWTSTTGTQMKNQAYLPAGTQTLNGMPIEVQVADLFSNVYRMQCNEALPITSPGTACFFNYNFTLCEDTPASPRTSQSTVALDVASGGGSSNNNYWFTGKIVGCPKTSINGSSNTWYDPYPEVLVMINAHAYKPGTNGSNGA